MAKQDKIYSFANEAKRIMKQFPRRETDSIEKRDYEQAMQELVQMQEAERESLGLNQSEQSQQIPQKQQMMPQQQFGNGGKMMYPFGGYGDPPSILPSDFEISSNIALANKYPKLPTDFQIKSDVGLGNMYRAQHPTTPMMSLIGLQPGYTEADNVYGTNKSTINSIPAYNVDTPQKIYPTGLEGDLSNPPLTPEQFRSMARPWSLPQPDKVPYTFDVNRVIPNFRNMAYSQTNANNNNTQGITKISPTNVTPNNTPTSTSTNPVKQAVITPRNEGYDSNSRMVTNTARQQSINTPNFSSTIEQPSLEVDKLGNGNLQGYQYNPKESFFDANKQYLPYILSGASNIASNLLLASLTKKNQPKYNPTIASPEKINLEPQAEQLRKSAGVTKNVAMRNARNLGLNAGSTLANIGAIGADVDRGLGANLTNLYRQQEQTNVGAANQFNLANQQAINQGKMVNTQLDLANKEAQLGYLSGALGTLPGVMKDVRMDKADKATRDMYSAYYKSMGRNYMNEGDIWDNPEDGFRYVVRNNQLIKEGKNK